MRDTRVFRVSPLYKYYLVLYEQTLQCQSFYQTGSSGAWVRGDVKFQIPNRPNRPSVCDDFQGS